MSENQILAAILTRMAELEIPSAYALRERMGPEAPTEPTIRGFLKGRTAIGSDGLQKILDVLGLEVRGKQ